MTLKKDGLKEIEIPNCPCGGRWLIETFDNITGILSLVCWNLSSDCNAVIIINWKGVPSET